MGGLFLSHNIFYAPNEYGAVHIGKKRRRISMMPMEKSVNSQNQEPL